MVSASVDDLAGAQGKFMLFVASLLQRADVAPIGQFSRLLKIVAMTVEETSPEEAKILRSWAEGLQIDADL